MLLVADVCAHRVHVLRVFVCMCNDVITLAQRDFLCGEHISVALLKFTILKVCVHTVKAFGESHTHTQRQHARKHRDETKRNSSEFVVLGPQSVVGRREGSRRDTGQPFTHKHEHTSDQVNLLLKDLQSAWEFSMEYYAVDELISSFYSQHIDDWELWLRSMQWMH